MDDRQFDSLTRRLGAGLSRRALTLPLLGAALAAAGLTSADGAVAKKKPTAAKKSRQRPCLKTGTRCTAQSGGKGDHCDRCCSGFSKRRAGGGRRCVCAPAGKPCTKPGQCCSGICDGTTCQPCEPGFKPCDNGCIPKDACCAPCGEHGECVEGSCACKAGFQLCNGGCIAEDACCETCDPICQSCVGGTCQAANQGAACDGVHRCCNGTCPDPDCLPYNAPCGTSEAECAQTCCSKESFNSDSGLRCSQRYLYQSDRPCGRDSDCFSLAGAICVCGQCFGLPGARISANACDRCFSGRCAEDTNYCA